MAEQELFDIVNPPDIAPPKPTYSHVTVTRQSGRLVSIAGQGPIDAEYNLVAEDRETQVKAALANLNACLRAAGAQPKDVIKVTHWAVDYDANDRDWMQHYTDFWLPGPPPATTFIPVTKLARPGWLYEIEATAILPDAS